MCSPTPPILNDVIATTHKDATIAQDTPSTKRPQSTEQATPEVNNPENNGRKSWVWNHFTYVENMTQTNCPYCKKLIKCQVKKMGQVLWEII